MSDGKLIFETAIDTSGFEQGVSKVKAIGNQSGSSSANIMKGILGADIIKEVAQQVIQFGKDVINVASNLEEVQNVIDVTFGDNANQIEAWAENARTQFGLTELQAKQFTGTMGAMLKSMNIKDSDALEMSTTITGLAADMASFYNLDHEEAFAKIRSGISGETEPLKQLGINMSVANLEAYALSQGITKAYDKMTQAEQATLRYNYLLSATADAQGDFARTSDSYANAMRTLETNVDTLKATLGEALLPVVNWVVGGLNDLLGAVNDLLDVDETLDQSFNKINTTFQQSTRDIDAAATRADTLTDILAGLEDKTSLTANEQALWNRTLTELKGVVPGLNSLIDEQTGKVAGGTEAIREHTKAWAEDAKTQALSVAFKAKDQAIAEERIAIADLTIAYKDAQVEETRLSDERRAAMEGLASLSGLSVQTIEGIGGKSLSELSEAEKTFILLYSEEMTALSQSDAAYKSAIANRESLSQQIDESTQTLEEHEAQLQAQKEELGYVAEETETVTEATDDMAEAQERAIIAGRDVTQALARAGVSADDGAKRFSSYTNVAQNMFERISTRAPVSVNRMIKNLQANTKTLEDWQKNLQTLGGQLPDDLLKTLEEQGPEKMAGTVKALAKASPKQLEALTEAWESGGTAAMDALLASLGVEPTESDAPLTDAATADAEGAVEAYTNSAPSLQEARTQAFIGVATEGAEATTPLTDAATADAESAVTVYEQSAQGIEDARNAALTGATAQNAQSEQAQNVIYPLTLAAQTDVQGAVDVYAGAADRIAAALSGTQQQADGGEDASSETALSDTVAGIVGEAISVVENAEGDMRSAVRRMLSQGISAGRGYYGNAKSLGTYIVDGIISGAKSKSGALSDALKKIVKDALAAAQAEAKVGSPSKLFRDELGAFLPLGAAEGVEMNARYLNAAITDMIDGAADGLANLSQTSAISASAMSAPMQLAFAAQTPAAPTAAQVTQTINFNTPMQAPDEIAREMRKQARYGLAWDRR